MLDFDNALVNCFGKIWIFWRNDWEGSVMINSFQQVTMRFIKCNMPFIITSVYARCNVLDRLELWEELERIDTSNYPWMVEGDFNMILHEEEKLGSLDFTQQEAINFVQYINNCALSEINFTYSKYT